MFAMSMHVQIVALQLIALNRVHLAAEGRTNPDSVALRECLYDLIACSDQDLLFELSSIQCTDLDLGDDFCD